MRHSFCSRTCRSAWEVATFPSRFWAKIQKSDGCWEWQAGRDVDGYGKIAFAGQGQWKAHRVAYVLTYGAIDPVLWVLHHCDNPPCCRPDHLFLGTHQDNENDKVRKRRQPHGETHTRAKFTTADIGVIRARCAMGVPFTTIAAEYGVTEQAVRAVHKRLVWTHVP